MGNFMAGVTGQIKLSDRVALTGISQLSLTQKRSTFDGAHFVQYERIWGSFNGTVGITVYLGKMKHADWVTLIDNLLES
jgi:OOP family OmpA-OmpF porin